jgi:hypothetical protein
VKPCLSGSGSRAKMCKTPLRVNGELNFTQEIAVTEVKGWITKNSVPKREAHKRTDSSSTTPPDRPLSII